MDVGFIIFPGIEDRLGDKDPRREVVNAVDALQQGPQLGSIRDVAAVEKDLRLQTIRIPRAEIVQDQHFMVFGCEGIGKRAADEAGPACDEYSHASSRTCGLGDRPMPLL